MSAATIEDLWRRALDSCRDDLLPRGAPASDFAYGMLRLLAAEPKEAADFLSLSAAAAPAAKTFYLLGLARAAAGDPAGALAAFHQTVDSDADLVPAWYQAAAVLRRLGRSADEVALLRRAVEHFGGTSYERYVLNELAIALQRLGQMAEAVETFRRAVRCPSGDSVACRANLAQLLERSGQRTEARQLLDGVQAERSRRQSPHPLPQVSFLIYYVLGNLDLADGRPIRASRHYRRSLEFLPDSATAWNSLAVACHAAGHRRLAASALRRALEIDPKFTAAQRNLERLGERRGDAA
jgi:tetratricopeptide (TPR) repeat protein